MQNHEPRGNLLFAVRFNVVLGRMLRVIGGVRVVPVSQVGVMGSLFVIALGMRSRGRVVVARSVIVVLSCLLVVFCCFV